MSDQENEIWKPVPGFINLEASSLGRLREFRILPQSPCGDTTYMSSKVLLEGENAEKPERRTRNVHRLVALAFHGFPPDPKMVPDHKDTNKHNNEASNLEWVTKKENYHRAVKAGLIALSLSEEQMDEISRRYFDEGQSMKEISEELAVTVNQVKSCVMIWRAGDRKGRVNPHERKIDAIKAKQFRKLAKNPKMSDEQLAKTFNISVDHARRMRKGERWGEVAEKEGE